MVHPFVSVWKATEKRLMKGLVGVDEGDGLDLRADLLGDRGGDDVSDGETGTTAGRFCSDVAISLINSF